MKQTIILLALFAVGCHEKIDPSKPYSVDRDYTTVEYEGCHYIQTHVTANFTTLTHKGNCPNPIHYSDTCCKHK